MSAAPERDTRPKAATKRRLLTREGILLVIALSPVAWCGGSMYFQGRRNADALCELATPGMPIDEVIEQAARRRIDVLDDRLYRKVPQSTDGELISMTSPFSFRRTCTVAFKGNVVQSVRNDAGPN